jgi:hypothetical protein
LDDVNLLPPESIRLALYLLLAWAFPRLIGDFHRFIGGPAERLAVRIVKRAAGRLPWMDRGRYEEEWLAELEGLPHGTYRLLFAISVMWGSRRLRGLLKTPPPPKRIGPADVADIVRRDHRITATIASIAALCAIVAGWPELGLAGRMVLAVIVGTLIFVATMRQL